MSATAPVRISYYAYPSLDINGAVDVAIGEVEFDPSITKDLPAFAAYGSTERLLHTAIRILLANSNQINDIVGDYYALTDHGFAVKRRQPTTAKEVEYYVLQTGFLPTSIRTLTDLAVNVMAKWLHTPIESIVVQISYDSEITSERQLSQQMRECTQMGKAYRQLDHHTWIITPGSSHLDHHYHCRSAVWSCVRHHRQLVACRYAWLWLHLSVLSATKKAAIQPTSEQVQRAGFSHRQAVRQTPRVESGLLGQQEVAAAEGKQAEPTTKANCPQTY